MSELETFQRHENKANSLSAAVRQRIAQDTAILWTRYSHAIRPLLLQSKEAWQLYLENSPAAKTNSRKGIRIGHIARSVDSVHAFQHNTTFPSEERFFKGTALNEAARQFLDLYESWAAVNLAESRVIEAMFNHRKRLLLDGTACLSVQYQVKKSRTVKYEFPTMRVPNPFMGGELNIPLTFLTPKEVEIPDDVTWEGTIAESLELSDWRVDPSVASLEESPFLRRWYEPIWKIKRDYPELDTHCLQSYQNFQKNYQDNLKASFNGIDLNWSLADQEKEGSHQALLMVRYDDFVIDDVVYENHVALVLNDTELHL